MLKAAFIQFAPIIGNLNKTISKLELLIEKTGKTNLVVIPELANSGYNFNSKEQAFDLAENINKSQYIEFLEDKCKKFNLFIVSGFNEKEKNQIFNTAVLIGPKGIIGKYRKIHLFMNEKDYFSKGNLGLPVFDIGFCKIGLLICFDWIFPEVWRILALKGADIICHPSNLVLPYAQKAIPIHAMLNKVFIITTNRTGKEGNLTFTGKSIIANPNGEILMSASENEEETAIVKIDPALARNKMMTERNDIFKDRITEDYKEIIN
ncbi:MAG: hypothetical protein K8R58_00955 [Bacteroidales bacterium]|nr:hypothetical protein [Bacteroidales bacterium]